MNLVIITIILLIIVALAIILFFVITKLVNRHQINEELESTPLRNNEKTNKDENKYDLICSKCKRKIEIKNGYHTYLCRHKLCAKCSNICFNEFDKDNMIKEMKCHECGIEYIFFYFHSSLMHKLKFQTKDFFRENSLESSAYPGECCICSEKKVDTQRSKFCDHSFCRSCFEQFLRNYNVDFKMPQCPLCKTPIEDKKLLEKYDPYFVQWRDIY